MVKMSLIHVLSRLLESCLKNTDGYKVLRKYNSSRNIRYLGSMEYCWRRLIRVDDFLYCWRELHRLENWEEESIEMRFE